MKSATMINAQRARQRFASCADQKSTSDCLLLITHFHAWFQLAKKQNIQGFMVFTEVSTKTEIQYILSAQ